MAAKKKPTTHVEKAQKAANEAAELADGLLRLAAVVEQLARVPKPAFEWAVALKERGGFGSHLPNPVDRLGQKGLERRLSNLRDGVTKVYPEGGADAIELSNQIDTLERAVATAGLLPLLKRKSAHSRIDERLDEIETALVDAILLAGPSAS